MFILVFWQLFEKSLRRFEMLSTQQNGSDRLATQQRQIQFEELSIASLQEAHLGKVSLREKKLEPSLEIMK